MDAKNKFLSKEGLVHYHEKIQEQLSKKFPIKGELNSYHHEDGFFEDDSLTDVSDAGIYLGDTYTLLVVATNSAFQEGGLLVNQLKFSYESESGLVENDAQPVLYHRVYTNNTWSYWERVNIEKGTYLEGSTTDSGEFFASENAIDLQAGGAVTQLRLDGANATLSHMDSSTTLTVGNDDISMTAGNNSAVFGLGGGDGIELRYNNNSITMDPQMGIKISADQDGLALQSQRETSMSGKTVGLYAIDGNDNASKYFRFYGETDGFDFSDETGTASVTAKQIGKLSSLSDNATIATTDNTIQATTTHPDSGITATNVNYEQLNITGSNGVHLEGNSMQLQSYNPVRIINEEGALVLNNSRYGDEVSIDVSELQALKNNTAVNALESRRNAIIKKGAGTKSTISGDAYNGVHIEATAQGSHAEGGGTKAKSDAAHAEGVTTVAGRLSQADTTNTSKVAQIIAPAAAKIEMPFSTAAEQQAAVLKLGGFGAHAEGMSTQALGTSSHAEGSNNVAFANSTHVEGDSNKAMGETAHAEGWNNYAGGNQSHVEGANNYAMGDESHAEGNNTNANGRASHAEGIETVAEGRAAHAEGEYTRALGNLSHAEGGGDPSVGDSMTTTAEGWCSHAEGWATYALGDVTHTEGYHTSAYSSAKYSHAEGIRATTGGYGSHAEGIETYAKSKGSHAAGIATKATGEGQTVVGVANAEDDSALFIVGNGTYEESEDPYGGEPYFGAKTRSNAFVVYQNGDIKIGNVTLTQEKLAKLMKFIDNMDIE